MEPKKNENLDLERKRPLFFFIGMVMAMSFVIVAFEWKSEFDPIDLVPRYDEPEYPYFPDITIHEKPEAPRPVEVEIPKPKVNQVAEVVELDDNTEIEKDEAQNFPDIEEIDFPENWDDLGEAAAEVVEEAFVFVESMPSFPGGDKAFLAYMAKGIKYPRKAKNVGAEGKVYLEFVINKDGSVSDIKLIKGIGMGCDEEAIRVLSASPKWSPGKQRGVPLRVKRVMPVYFELN